MLYVCEMPRATQDKILMDVIIALSALDTATSEDVELAMNSKIQDLEDLIDIKPYI